jgi:hypothetical protein
MSYALLTVLGAFTLPRIENALLPAWHTTVSVVSAQTFLSTVASGMMALTGIVFSIAFVMVQFSAIAYSPRLVQWMGRDKVLFHSMGVFIATFTYSLATLVWIDRSGSGQVPFASMGIVTLLLIASVFLFALLVQRIASLSITSVLHFIGKRGRVVIRETFPRGADVVAVIDAAEEARGDLGTVTQTLHYQGKPRSIARFDIPALVRQASSGLPSFSDSTEHPGKHWLCVEQLSELLDERQQAVFRHGRDELVEHDALPQQRMGASLGGVGLEHPVEAERFAGGAEQGQQRHGEGVDQPKPVAAGGGADMHFGHTHAEADILAVPKLAFDIPYVMPLIV